MPLNHHLKDPRRLSRVTASQAYDVIYNRKKLWRQMTYREPPFSGSPATDYGLRYEYVALSHVEKELGEILEPGNRFYVHSEIPLGASPDFFYQGFPGEIKCPYTQTIYPEIPERYYYQCQVQMAVTEKLKNYFYIWTPLDTKLEIIPFSQTFMDWFTPYVIQFIDYVQADKEPPKFNRRPVFNYKGE